MNNDNNIDKLIEYITILNNYQHGNYKLNSDEVNVIKTMQKSNDLKTRIEVDKINKMAFSEREQYLESLNEKKNQQNGIVNSIEEEIALTFGVDSSNIKVSRLQDGKQLYTFFDDELKKNIVLQDDGSKSLMSKLEEIRSESSKDADVEKEDILEDERVKNGLEVKFIFLSEIGHHISEIAAMNEDKRRALKYLIDHAIEFGIVEVNLENVVGIDSYGNIFEIYIDEMTHEPRINNVDNNQIQETNDKDEKYSKSESEVNKDSQLSQMLEESAEIEQENLNNSLNADSQGLENPTVGRVLQRQKPQNPQNNSEDEAA